jgi:hypothetical protein
MLVEQQPDKVARIFSFDEDGPSSVRPAQPAQSPNALTTAAKFLKATAAAAEARRLSAASSDQIAPADEEADVVRIIASPGPRSNKAPAPQAAPPAASSTSTMRPAFRPTLTAALLEDRSSMLYSFSGNDSSHVRSIAAAARMAPDSGINDHRSLGSEDRMDAVVTDSDGSKTSFATHRLARAASKPALSLSSVAMLNAAAKRAQMRRASAKVLASHGGGKHATGGMSPPFAGHSVAGNTTHALAVVDVSDTDVTDLAQRAHTNSSAAMPTIEERPASPAASDNAAATENKLRSLAADLVSL